MRLLGSSLPNNYPRPNMRLPLICLLLILHVIMIGWNATQHSPVWHEPSHVLAGIKYWQSGCTNLMQVNPPLVYALSAVPVLLISDVVVDMAIDRMPQRRPEFCMGQYFAMANQVQLQQLFTLARWSCIPFSILGACICFSAASRLYGVCSGVLAMVVWCISPCVLGYASIVTNDVVAASIGITAVYCFWHWLRKPAWSAAIVTGLVLGLAELSKFTLLILYPFLPVAWFVYRLPERKTTRYRDWLGQGTMLVITLLVSVFMLNAGYLFENSFTRLKDFRFQSMLFSGYRSLDDTLPKEGNRFASTWFGELLVPLPANMVYGIDAQRYDFEQGLPSYLRGEWADHGWWYYYIYAMAVKEPLGTWCLVTLAVGTTIFGRKKWIKPVSSMGRIDGPRQNCYLITWRDEVVMLMPGLVILIFVSSQMGFSVHSRYIIPALPFLFVWLSKVAQVFEVRPFTPKRLVIMAVVGFSLIWSVGSSLSIYPHSLSYFNELAAILPTPADASYPTPICRNNKNSNNLSAIISAGPCNGPCHLLDSNIDWGQDLLYLKEWLDGHSAVKLDGLACWSSYPATLAGIPETPYPPPGLCKYKNCSKQVNESRGPKSGWYAVSVNYIYSRDRQYRYFLHFQPVAMAGYSIYIYHITLDEANQVRRELGLPELKVVEGEEKEWGQAHATITKPKVERSG